MINEPFHTMAHSWRYNSRQKMLLSNLHLAQLPDDVTGESVFISVVPPTGTGRGGFTVPPISLPPITPYGGFDWRRSTNNFPPFWENTTDGLGASFQSGTYGFASGTIGNFIAIRTVSSHVWPMTGGVFLFQGFATTGQDNFGQMNPTRIRLYTTNVNGGLGAPYLQDAEQVVQMKGVGWNNQMYLSEGNVILRTSLIVAHIPFGYALSQYATPSVNDPLFNSYGSVALLSLRLGPDAE